MELQPFEFEHHVILFFETFPAALVDGKELGTGVDTTMMPFCCRAVIKMLAADSCCSGTVEESNYALGGPLQQTFHE